MEKIYREYGEAVIQVKIWTGKVVKLEELIQKEMNKEIKKEPKDK